MSSLVVPGVPPSPNCCTRFRIVAAESSFSSTYSSPLAFSAASRRG